MITKFMQLNSTNDAETWAGELGLQNDEQERRIAEWLWDNKPTIGCTYDQHPISSLSDDEFWAIANADD